MAAGFETEAPKRRTSTASERAFLGISALLFLVCAVGTIYYSLTSMPNGMAMPGQSWLGAAAGFMGMWMVMMATMMLPSLVPELSSYRRFVDGPDETRLGGLTVLAGAGYFCVWAGFGVVAYLLGLLWTSAGMFWMDLARLTPFITGAVLLLAGGLQLTPWKAHQLDCCRDTQTLAGSTSPKAG